MSFTLKYGDLRADGFLVAMSKIESCTTFPTGKTAYDMGRMMKEIINALSLCQDEFIVLLKDYAALDSEGKFIPLDNKPDTYQIIPERMDAWKKALTDFAQRTVTIQRHKIDMNDLSCVGLSPKDMLALEPILLT